MSIRSPHLFSVLRPPILALLIVLTGCATGYKPKGAFGDGYSEERVGSDVWMVTFDASAFTPRERMDAFLLWRCAEITLDHRATYFGIVNDGKPARRTSTRPTLIDKPPFPTDTAPSESEVPSGRSARMTIQLYPERPDSVDRYYEARTILQRLAPLMRGK
jgi:hypothetical protein